MQTKIEISSSITGYLTTERPESSYGIPVLVVDSVAYGQSDMVPNVGTVELFGGVDAKTCVKNFWERETFACSELPIGEYNLIAKFIGLDVANA